MRSRRLLIPAIAGAVLCIVAGCGGKYDKPLEVFKEVRFGEYSYVSGYGGFDNAVALSIASGTIYVAYCDTVTAPPSGTVRAYFSGGAPVPANLFAPLTGLARPTAIGAGTRAIAVADGAGPITVRVYGLSGGSPTVSFSDPDWRMISGLAVDDTGNIYVCDAERNFVRSYRSNGKRRFEIDLADSGFGIGHVLRPTGLALDGETLLVSEGHPEKAQVQRIRIDQPQTGIPFSTENPYISVYTDAEGDQMPLAEPVGVAAGREGSIIILDRGLGKILRFNTDGVPVALVNSAESGGPLDLVNAVSIDVYNNPQYTSASIYVLDAPRGLVHRWDPK